MKNGYMKIVLDIPTELKYNEAEQEEGEVKEEEKEKEQEEGEVKEDMRVYRILFGTTLTEFYCNECSTSLSSRCYCKDHDWMNNSINNDLSVASSSQLKDLLPLYRKMESEKETLQEMNIPQLYTWFIENADDVVDTKIVSVWGNEY